MLIINYNVIHAEYDEYNKVTSIGEAIDSQINGFDCTTLSTKREESFDQFITGYM